MGAGVSCVLKNEKAQKPLVDEKLKWILRKNWINNMKILENDIASTEPFGIIDGKQVSLVRLRGGLNLATRIGAKGEPEVLGAASHQAILCYTIEQRYPSFQPAIMKSEGLKLTAESHSHFLSDELRKSGHDIYSIQNGNEIEFFVTKQNIKVGSANGSIADNCLNIQSLNVQKEHVNAISSAVSEKALSSNLKEVRVK